MPVGYITNGVHVPSWDSPGTDALWESVCGKERWRGALETVADAIRDVPHETLWETKAHDRQRLVHGVRVRLARQLGFRGADRIHPERQTIRKDDLVRATQPDYLGGQFGRDIGWRVAEVEPGRVLALGGWAASSSN